MKTQIVLKVKPRRFISHGVNPLSLECLYSSDSPKLVTRSLLCEEAFEMGSDREGKVLKLYLADKKTHRPSHTEKPCEVNK